MSEPTDEFETRLGRQLQRQASAITVAPDERDLFARAERRARRVRRAFTAALAATLLVGPVAGYLAGRAGDGKPSTIAASGDGDGSGTRDGASVASDDVQHSDVSYGGSFEGMILNEDWSLRYERLFERTTADGVSLRVFGASMQVSDDGNPRWDPPGWCVYEGLLRVGTVSDSITGVVSAPRFRAPRDGLQGTVTLTGYVEGEPTWVVIAQASDADEVVATFPGGATDRAEVRGGVAVLAARAPASVGTSPDQLAGKPIELESNREGRRVAAVTLPKNLSGQDEQACQEPPPSLPEPGEQPADVEAARAGVIKAYEIVYDGSLSDAEHDLYLEDPEDLVDVREQLDRTTVDDPSKGSSATVKDLVFVAPDHAWVLFQIYLNDSPWNTPQLGEAVFVDGKWRVAQSTFCRLTRLAGVTCP
jgi:hypothetical protein